MIRRAIEAMTRVKPEDNATAKAARQLIKGDRTSTLKLFEAGVYNPILFEPEDGTDNRD